MQFLHTTDYAVRIVFYVAEQRRMVNSTEIAQAMDVPLTVMGRIGRKLIAAGILTSQRGNTGGLALARKPRDITMADIIYAVEDIHINRCLEPDHVCPRGAVETCPVHAFYAQVQDCLDTMLAGKTVESLLTDNANLTGKRHRPSALGLEIDQLR